MLSGVIGPPDGYCGTCYDAAAKAGRTVRLTQYLSYPVCGLCEGRLSNGLVHYQPSNGTEFYDYFMARCDRCRHFDHEGTRDPRVKACAWGVLDKLLNGQMEGPDSGNFWFDPADLSPGCPADCRRFTDENDPNGEWRDPPRPDVKGQTTFEDALEVVERVPEFAALDAAGEGKR